MRLPAAVALLLAGILGRSCATTTPAPVIHGCAGYRHGTSPMCTGYWWQEGPGAQYPGATANIRRVGNCPLQPEPCTATDDWGPIVGSWVDDTSPCPASLRGAPGTQYIAGLGWVGAPCVQYYVDEVYAAGGRNIYAGLAPGIDGTETTRFSNATTLLEWFPYLNGGPLLPPSDEQGYVLQWHLPLDPVTDAQFLTLWDWCAAHGGGSVMAWY